MRRVCGYLQIVDVSKVAIPNHDAAASVEVWSVVGIAECLLCN